MKSVSTVFDVFFVQADLSAGSYTVERDYGVAGLVDRLAQVDIEELADTSFQSDFYTRETETDGWWHIGGSGSSAVDGNGFFSFQSYRYVKVVVTKTGGDSESAVVMI